MKKPQSQTSFSPFFGLPLQRFHRLALLGAACLASQSGFVDRADAATQADLNFASGYTDGGNLVGQNGWVQFGNNTASPIKISSSTVSLGNATASQQAYKQYTPYQFAEAGGQVFMRLDINVSAASTAGNDFFVVTREVTSSTVLDPNGKNYFRIYVKASGAGYVLGWNPHAETTTGTFPVYDTTVYTFNQANTLLVRCDSFTGRNNDRSYLYVNPTWTDTLSTLTPLLSRTTWSGNNNDEFSHNVSTSGTRVGGYLNIVLKQSTSGSALKVSRIMVGDALADVGILPPTPAAPVSGAATYVSPDGFTANWQASAGASKYFIDVATDSSFSTVLSSYSNLDVGNVSTKAVTGSFTPGTSVFYRVRAYNASGTSVSSTTQEVAIALPTEKNYVSSATTGSVNWNDTTVWSGAVAPASAEITTLTFDGNVTGTLNSTNDLTGNLTLNGLNVSNTGTGTLNLKGSPLQFVTNSVATGTPLPQITFANGLTATSSVQNNLILANDLSVSKATGAGNLTTSLDGVISGTGALVKKGGGTVTIFGTSNTYSGGTKVNEGQLTVNTINGSLGTGNITLGNGNTTGTLRWGDSFSGSSETSDKTITLTGTGGGGVLNLRGSNSLTLTGAIDTGSDTSSRAMQFTGSGGNLTVSGLITGNGKLRINGSDNRTNSLTNENNSFTGGVTLDGNISSKIYRTYVSKIGMAGANSPLGTNGTINFGTNHSGTAYNFLMWTSSVDETTDKVINLTGNLSGGLLVNKGTAKLKFTSNVTANALGSKTLYLDQDNVNAATELAGSIPDGDSAIGRTTSINKNGLGTLTLSGANTYTGNTTIKGGVLEIKNASALNAGSVIFADPGSDSLSITFRNTAVLKLACAGVNASLNTLVVGSGSSAINGRIDLGTAPGNVITFANADGWNASSILTVANTATGKLYISSFKDLTTPQVVSAENPTYTATFDSNGLLSFVDPNPPSGFSSWISGFTVADKTASDDSDNDGINNLLEYVLNGDPSVASTSILPSSVVTQSAFEFTFSRRADSKNDTTLTFQYGSTLAGWTDITIPVSSGTVGGATVTVTADGNSADTVKVSIPSGFAVGGKLFGRLKVAQ